MIYVTQGHEKGIGLEIFLKSFLLLNKNQQEQILLFVDPKDLNSNLNDLSLNPSLFKNLKIIQNKSFSKYSSTNSLLTALEIITKDDILVTLPTSKDQLILNNQSCAGYTEFFRSYYSNNYISMTFKGIHQNIMLITDHIPHNKVSSTITSQLIYEKVKSTLNQFEKYFYPIDEVIFSGINPHVGENGILGDEDKIINAAIINLSKDFNLKLLGPYSGDTLHHCANSAKIQLFVYMFHDQGLAQFKSKYGLIGLNISFGLPFLRLSVDHGTAFDLYGKNKANISGMLHLLNQAFEVISYVN